MSRMHDLWLDTQGLTLEQAETYGEGLAEQQRAVNWMIGDVARYAKYVLKLGDNYTQAFPPWVSPGLIQRCEAVASAYPREVDRNILATWTQHMSVANRPDRLKLVAEMVTRGETSDESRKHIAERPSLWLLAIDVNYFLHRTWFSGAGVEAAMGVAGWIQRMVERLKEKGLTDVVCCFDSPTNHRKELTREWEDHYKDRPPKPAELVQQLHLVHDLLKGHGFACVSIDGYEADDVMASYAKQFKGRVTLLTQDKDCRQCLSETCNMLLDVEWTQDESSGESLPQYKWLSAKQHTDDTGIRPDQWVSYQSIMGDATDGITGACGIGAKGAAELVKTFGTVEAAIQAAKDDNEHIPKKKRDALIELEAKLSVTKQLVTLVASLPVPMTTRV